MIKAIIKKSMEGGILTKAEIATLYLVPVFSDESALIIAAARRKSEITSDGIAEVYGQVGLNISRCPGNCSFCAFAADSRVFNEPCELPVEEVLVRARRFESTGANAIFIASTLDYPFERYLDVSAEIRKALRPETVMVANAGDLDRQMAERLRDAGYAGIYHAVRLGEGRDTAIDPDRRRETIRHAKECGLKVGTCLEPVGNEHTVEDLVEKTVITRDSNPAFSGAARRIPAPGTVMESDVPVSMARMAHIIAVVRLTMGLYVPGTCTHEPNVTGTAAGANILWAEAGLNPRDVGRSKDGSWERTIRECMNTLAEGEWEVLEGPSRFFAH